MTREENDKRGAMTIGSLSRRTTGPARRSTKGNWTPEEDAILFRAVQCFNGKNWKKIAESFPNRTDVQCLHRWQKVLNPDLVKGPWSKEEDDIIIEMVSKFGPKKWSTIAQALPGRIGKQCRERWHNHLNPTINKEAWTQEEEIMLIHAHQTYGNKWAELTKFLPGRTDNAIKNHWNSSVKKKLDSYLASGLLSQFQGPPHPANSSCCASLSSATQHNSEGSSFKDTQDVGDSSECSQASSAMAVCPEPDFLLALPASCHDLRVQVDAVEKQSDDSQSLACPKEECYTSMEVHYQGSSSNINQGHNLLQEFKSQRGDAQMYSDEQLRNNALPKESLSIGGSAETSQYHSLFTENYEIRSILSPSTTIPNMSGYEAGVLSESENHKRHLSSGVGWQDISLQGLICAPDAINFDSYLNVTGQPDAYSSEAYGDVTACPYPVCSVNSSSNMDHSCCHSLTTSISPSFLCQGNYNDSKSMHMEPHDSEIITSSYNGCAYSSQPCMSSGAGASETTQESTDIKAAPMEIGKAMLSNVNETVMTKEQQCAGGLFYEPPRFPSIDIPFVSCDLVTSGDLQQEYSPFGIRQLMRSSNLSTPCNLWGSPSHDDSPNALLKSAAKSFTSTPSILKKRHRDLLSPMTADGRTGKKSEMEMGTMMSDISSIKWPDSSTFSINNEVAPSSDYQKSKHELSDKNEEDLGHPSVSNEAKGSEKESNAHSVTNASSCSAVLTEASSNLSKIVEAPGILVERDVNNLILSPCHGEDPANALTKSLIDQTFRCLESTPKDFSASQPESFSNRTSEKCHVATTKPLEVQIQNCCASIAGDFENLNIFADTPGIKRGLESPSAWKSPDFINSLITYPDISYVMSPMDRTYDALGLMRQFSEHTASVVAEAQEVLASPSPKSPRKVTKSENEKPMKEHDQSEMMALDIHKVSPKIMAEARVLDFNDCSSPVRRTEEKKAGSADTSVGLSRPSTYLMKNCR